MFVMCYSRPLLFPPPNSRHPFNRLLLVVGAGEEELGVSLNGGAKRSRSKPSISAEPGHRGSPEQRGPRLSKTSLLGPRW